MPRTTPAGRARLAAGAAIAAAFLVLAGCGGGGPKIVPVSGTVTIDGQPLTYGHVQVIPTGWRPASGRLDGNGRFTLTTTVANDGCAVGTHPVAILAGESLTPETMKWHAPQKYSDIQTSNLTVTISGPTDDLKIELRSDGSMKPGKVSFEGGSEFAK
jgi:hypothetical protein